MSRVLNNFSTNQISKEAVEEILRSALTYTINFDLLVPDYEETKIITVDDMLQIEDQNLIKTGKRLGFRFEQDKTE